MSERLGGRLSHLVGRGILPIDLSAYFGLVTWPSSLRNSVVCPLWCLLDSKPLASSLKSLLKGL